MPVSCIRSLTCCYHTYSDKNVLGSSRWWTNHLHCHIPTWINEMLRVREREWEKNPTLKIYVLRKKKNDRREWNWICLFLFSFVFQKITWLKDGQPVEINRNGRFILSNENSLLIAQIKQTDAGNYTCVASNIAGTYSSEPAELIVHGINKWKRNRKKEMLILSFFLRWSWMVRMAIIFGM